MVGVAKRWYLTVDDGREDTFWALLICNNCRRDGYRFIAVASGVQTIFYSLQRG